MSEPSRFTGHDPRAGADTHGVPWAGRELPPTPFAGDTGEPDARVRAALGALAAAASADAPVDVQAAREADLVSALASARVFVPVVAEAVALTSVGSQAADDRSDMASLVLTAPDGRRGLPVFTSVAALASWNPQARPVPVAVPSAARAAADDSCDVVLVDLGTSEAAVVRLSQLWALAQGRPWLPAAADPVVVRAVSRLPDDVPAIVSAGAESGANPGTLVLVLVVRQGLDPSEVERVVTSAGERLAGDPDVRIRLDDLAVVLRAG